MGSRLQKPCSASKIWKLLFSVDTEIEIYALKYFMELCDPVTVYGYNYYNK